MKNKVLLLFAALAAAFNICAARAFILNSAPTYDEPLHVASGYSYWRTGEFRMNINDHPPLAELAAAAPLLLSRLNVFADSGFYAEKDQYNWADLFVYHNALSPEKIVNTARGFSYLIWTSLAAAIIFLLARELFSAAAGLLSVLIFLLMPVFISNFSLATTDAASAALYPAAFLAALLSARHSRAAEPKKARLYLVLCALATAGAMASKFSMAVLPGFILLTWLAEFWPGKGRSAELKKLVLPALAYLSLVFLALAAVYGFAQFGLYFKGLAATLSRNEGGRPSFIFGHYSLYGVWWYFPFAFLVKTPLSVLVLFAAGVFRSLKSGNRGHIWLYAPLMLYFIFAVASKLQIGIRHILPVMPLCVILAGAGAEAWLGKRYFREAAAALLLFLAFSVARAHPFYLAYFNEAAGGPANGYKYLVDSNLDWGQDLKTLADHLKKEGSPPVYLGYFGTARPEHYGMRYIPFGFCTSLAVAGSGVTPCDFGKVLLAVSATNLHGVYYGEKDTFRWLLAKKPVFIAGHSIFLYDLTEDAAARSAIASTFYARNLKRYGDCAAGRQK